ncbi:hypothetical protein GJ744_002776 [Endocarpon pusillum]|uniref:EF-hand domain-containing protein n=1 Tax=Endocarpon pusillum TaxID=364733 RepID=A0A8H7AMV4_9EURO|nr:hypothetical protein GJ744_002776 [Endocarpon pusillum]
MMISLQAPEAQSRAHMVTFQSIPNLNLTAEDKRVYGNLFKEADPSGFGAVSGDRAVKFFERTRLAA